jgi:Domain of unknown function (DUF4365)
MGMTPEQQKEEFSKAYVHAVAARNRFKLGEWTVDDGCLDVTVAAEGTLGGGKYEAPRVDLQLKCTSRAAVVKTDFISWPFEREHYDKLIASKIVPHLLVVLVLPPNEKDWLEHSVDQLILRRCAYWVKMTGMPAIKNQTSTVRLPRSQVFSPEQLKMILTTISRTGTL